MRSFPILVLSVLVAGLTGCAPQAEPDWQAAATAAQNFEDDASTKEGFLGSARLQSLGEGSQPSEEGEISISFKSSALVEGVTVACFGDGEARLGFTVRASSAWSGGGSREIDCDGVARNIEIYAPFDNVDGVRINGGRISGDAGVLLAIVTGVADAS